VDTPEAETEGLNKQPLEKLLKTTSPLLAKLKPPLLIQGGEPYLN
jgi:hypothetical protein